MRLSALRRSKTEIAENESNLRRRASLRHLFNAKNSASGVAGRPGIEDGEKAVSIRCCRYQTEGGHWLSRRNEIIVFFRIEGGAPPAACGTKATNRPPVLKADIRVGCKSEQGVQVPLPIEKNLTPLVENASSKFL